MRNLALNTSLKGLSKIEAEQRHAYVCISGYVRSRCICEHPAQVLVQVQVITLGLTGLVLLTPLFLHDSNDCRPFRGTSDSSLSVF
jgi:hypothetical protein